MRRKEGRGKVEIKEEEEEKERPKFFYKHYVSDALFPIHLYIIMIIKIIMIIEYCFPNKDTIAWGDEISLPKTHRYKNQPEIHM